jgi:hypothetical protein
MSGSGRLRVSAFALGVFGWLAAASAAGPWDKLLTANRVEADPQKAYNITEQNGPWMIMTCSFSGEKAREQAKELALELRKRYKLPAYVYEKKFDIGKDIPGRGVDEYGRPKKMKNLHRGAEVNEIAVLVGDYPSVDDPEAQETLRKLKYYQPDCLTLKEGKATSRNLAGLRWIQAAVLPDDNERKKRGPMSSAFVTTNPTLPTEYYAPKGLDPLLIKANEGVEHSLLDCPGKYTVQVAHFTGRVVMKQDEITAIEHGKDMDSQLAKATLMAHELTKALRMKGYDAYEFHDRYASIVTVGSFDSVGQQGANGVIEMDPSVKAILDQFKSDQSTPGVITAKTLVDIPFDPQPILVHVPKRTARTALNQNPMRGR